jgi:hypothetical protein
MMRLFEVECDSRLNVLPTHGKAGASASATSAAKQRLKKVTEATRTASAAEEVTEIAELNAPAFPARWRSKISTRLPVLAELIVALTLLRIGEDIIGLPDLLEFFFRAAVTRVDVRVIFARQLAVGFLDVVCSCGARHPQHFVIVLKLDSHDALSLF